MVGERTRSDRLAAWIVNDRHGCWRGVVAGIVAAVARWHIGRFTRLRVDSLGRCPHEARASLPCGLECAVPLSCGVHGGTGLSACVAGLAAWHCVLPRVLVAVA